VNAKNDVKVGALTIAGLALFLMIISFLGVLNFAGSGYVINVIYDQVSGLKIGNEVRFAGVPIGKVQDIQVNGTKVRAILKIDAKTKIPRNSRFSIGMDGVMGTKFVTVDPPKRANGEYYKDKEEVLGVKAQGLDDFMESSTKVLAKLEGIADAFNNVFGDKDVQKSMRDGFLNASAISKNLNTFSKVMADLASENQQEISQMVHDMSEMAAHMNSIMSGADNNGATGRNLSEMAANMATASKRIEEMATSLQGVVTDPQTKSDLKATIHNAKETSEKANKMLGIVADAKAQADVMYNGKNSKWRTDMGVRLPLQDNSFVYIGGADIGDDTKFDLHYGRKLNSAFGVRAGLMQGYFGVGMDYNLSKNFKLFTDVYDFNDTKLRLGGELALTRNFSLIAQSMNISKHGSDTTYLGVRSYF
jgi:ABC-type transport system involved in resistance to organic solvents, periplasmic component